MFNITNNLICNLQCFIVGNQIHTIVTNIRVFLSFVFSWLSEKDKSFVGYFDSAFLATFDTVSPAVTNPIVFNNAILNTGWNYNPETGIYTAPEDGIYQLMFNLASSADALYNAHLNVDGRLQDCKRRKTGK